MNTTSPFFEQQQQQQQHTMMANNKNTSTAASPPAANAATTTTTTTTMVLRRRRSLYVEFPNLRKQLDDHRQANTSNHYQYQDESNSTASMSPLSWNGGGGPDAEVEEGNDDDTSSSITQQARIVIRNAATEQQNPWRQQASMVVARPRGSSIVPSSSSIVPSSSSSPFRKHNLTADVTNATTYSKKLPATPMNLPWMMNENLPFLSSKAVFHLHLKRPAILIQAAVRGMLHRLRYQQLLVVTKFSPAAIIIQKVMRAKLQRLRFHVYCQELLQEYHVTNIQAWFRGSHLRRRFQRHYAVLVLQDTVRLWLNTTIRPRRHSLIHQCVHDEMLKQQELRQIQVYQQREMLGIQNEVEMEFAAAAANGEPIVLQPTAQEIQLQATATEQYQMMEYLYAEHVKLKHQQKKLRKGIHARQQVEKQQKTMMSQEEMDMMNDIITLQNVIIPRMEYNVQMGFQVNREWQDETQQTQHDILEYDLRCKSEQRISAMILLYMQQVVEIVDEHDTDSHDNNDNDSYDIDVDQQELAYYIKKLAFQVEFLKSRQDDDATEQQQEQEQ